MPGDKCIIILSEKSSGSSACQNLLARFADIQRVSRTRHFENETLYWTKAASILGKPQLKMVNSEVPIKSGKARADLITLLRDNLDDFTPPGNDEQLIMEGWRELCRKYSPVFLEKSPHHLCQWSAIDLMLQCMRELVAVDFLLIGLVRNPMDTIYSQYKRWKSPPERVERQWRIAYQNLMKLKDLSGDRVTLLRYEDMVSSIRCLNPVFDFCGVSSRDADATYLHSGSIQKWKNDSRFGFSLSPEVMHLAERYGYRKNEMTGTPPRRLWPVIKVLSRIEYLAAKPIKTFTRKRCKP